MIFNYSKSCSVHKTTLVHIRNMIFFRSPRTGLFSVKIQKKFLAINNFCLSMKRSPDYQINASFIEISRIKWLFFIAVVFLPYN